MASQSIDYSRLALNNLANLGLVSTDNSMTFLPYTAALFDLESSGNVNAVSPNKRNLGIGQIDQATADTVIRRHPELKGLDINNPEDNATLSTMNFIDGLVMQGNLTGALEQYRGGPGSVGKNTKDKSFGETSQQYQDKYAKLLETNMERVDEIFKSAGSHLQAQEDIITGKGAAGLQHQEVTSDAIVALQAQLADEMYRTNIETQKAAQQQALQTGLYDTTLSKQAAATQKITNKQTELGQKFAGVYDQASNGNFFERWWAKNVDMPKLNQEKDTLDKASDAITASGVTFRNQIATNTTATDYRNTLKSEQNLAISRELEKQRAVAAGDVTKQELINMGINYQRQLYQGDISLARLQNESLRIQTRQQEWSRRQAEKGNFEPMIRTLEKVGKAGYTKEILQGQPKEFLQALGELTAALENGMEITGDMQHKKEIIDTLKIDQKYWDKISVGFAQAYQEDAQAAQQTREDFAAKGVTKISPQQAYDGTTAYRIKNNMEGSVDRISQYANLDEEAIQAEIKAGNYSKALQESLTSLAKTDGANLDSKGQTEIVKAVVNHLRDNNKNLSDAQLAQTVWPLVEYKMKSSEQRMKKDQIIVPDEFGLTFEFDNVKKGIISDSVVKAKQTGVNTSAKLERAIIDYLATRLKEEADIKRFSLELQMGSRIRN